MDADVDTSIEEPVWFEWLGGAIFSGTGSVTAHTVRDAGGRITLVIYGAFAPDEVDDLCAFLQAQAEKAKGE